MREIKIININCEKFNPFGATPEELIAAALEEASLLKDTTEINNVSAKDYCNTLSAKKETFKESTKLGRLLITKGIITPDQLKLALDHQALTGMKLGSCLLELGFCTELEIEQNISTQINIRKDITELDNFMNKVTKIKERLRNSLLGDKNDKDYV